MYSKQLHNWILILLLNNNRYGQTGCIQLAEVSLAEVETKCKGFNYKIYDIVRQL